MRSGKIASGAEYQMDGELQNLLIFGIFEVLKFWKFFSFTIWKILKNSYLENFKNDKFGKLAYFSSCYEWLIWKMIDLRY